LGIGFGEESITDDEGNNSTNYENVASAEDEDEDGINSID